MRSILKFLAAASLLVFAQVTLAQGLASKFDPARDAAAAVAAATATAKAQRKRVMVDVGGEWCSWCHILDRFVTSNADVSTGAWWWNGSV